MTAVRKVHSFKESLAKANKAEQEWMDLFLSKYPEYALLKTDGRSHDFNIISPFGDFSLETKIDSYSMLKSPNMFVERWSSFEKKTDGGPWQSANKNVDLFCYYYSTEKIMLTANTRKLIIALEELDLKDKDLIPVFNKGYTTKGWKVPRKDLYDKGIITYCRLDDTYSSVC